MTQNQQEVETMINKKATKVESTTLERVSDDERKSWVDVALIQAGVMICVPSLMLGGLLAESMSLSNAIISGVIGYILSIVVTSIMGMQGSDLGVPTCVAALSAFGKSGTRILISTLFTISMIGWFALQTSVCGSAFSNLLSESFGINFPQKASIIIWGIIMLITAVYGIDALKGLNTFAVPALVVVTTIGCFMAIRSYGTEGIFLQKEQEGMSIMGGIALTISFMSVGMVTAPDFTRYQRTRKDAVKSSVIGIMPAGIAMLVMGAIMSRVTGQYDISVILCDIGIPLLGMLVLILATWTTNTTNAYSAGLNIVLMLHLKDDRRALVTMVAGLIGTILSVVGIINYFENFLLWVGYAFTPIAGVMMADYWIVRKAKTENWDYIEGWDWIGVIAWGIGVAVTVLIPQGFPIMQGMFASLAVFAVLKYFIRRANKNEQ